MFEKDLSDPVPVFEARVAVEITEAREADLEEISRASPYHRLNLLKARYRAGKCLMARIDGKLVAFNWYVFGTVYDESYRIDLGDGEIYCMDAMTYMPYRGLAIHTKLLSRLLIDARNAGFCRALTRASVMNISSWKTHMRLGWIHVGSTYQLHCRRWLGGREFGWSPEHPLVHVPLEAAECDEL